MSEENLEVPFEFGECHAHIFMDGKNYKKAVERHKNGVDESVIRTITAHNVALSIFFFIPITFFPPLDF